MAYSFDFMLDERTTAGIRRIWGDLARLGIAPPNESVGFRPCVPLAHAIQVDLPASKPELKRFATLIKELPIQLEGFGDAGGSIFLEVQASPELVRAHQDLHAFLKKLAQSPRADLQPAQWKPRITLAPVAGQAEMLKAAPLLAQIPMPIPGAIASVVIAQVNNVRYNTLLEAPLGGGNFRDRV